MHCTHACESIVIHRHNHEGRLGQAKSCAPPPPNSPLKIFKLMSGHVDDGETDLEAAYRETEEEAGIGRDSLRRLDNFTTELKYRVNRGRLKKVTFWLAESSTDRVVLSSESRTHKWACLKEACQLARFPEMVQALEDAEKFLKP